MPDAPKHPVTVGDLYVKDGSETFISLAVRPATVADLVSALRAEGAEERIAGALFRDGVASMVTGRKLALAILDALAEAQP